MKIKIGANNSLVPLPTTLVGAIVDNLPNYNTISDVGVAGRSNMITITMNKTHFTNSGIKKNKEFSVNIPNINIVKKTDYCGIYSGKNVNKSEIFETFYGKKTKAPMIVECPINMECKLIDIASIKDFNIYIGVVIETYCNSNLYDNGDIDFTKLNPIIFLMYNRSYWKLGEQFSSAWSVGKNYKGYENNEDWN